MMFGKWCQDQRINQWSLPNGFLKTKHSVDGSIEKFKAIFFTRGFSQKEGIDYEETFAPVARYTSEPFLLWLPR